MDVVIRKLEPGDEPRAAEACALFKSGTQSVQRAGRFLADPRNYLVVAEVGDDLAGFLVAYRLGMHFSGGVLAHGRTMAFVVLALSQLFHAFDVRDNRRSIFGLGLFTNKWLWLALGAGALLQWIIISVPALAGVFRVVALSGRDWGLAVALSLVPVALNELVKLVRRASRRLAG